MTTTSLQLPVLDLPETATSLGVLTVTHAAHPSALPLKDFAVTARVADRIAEVTVTQVFRNPHRESLEAVYVFPLPGAAAVSAFHLRVGDRIVTGTIAERGEARRNYQAALDAGKRAALLEQERDDVFTVQVGNLPPGEDAAVTLTYSARLPVFEDGMTELRLPLVVAPRYIPGEPLDTETVGNGVEADTDLVPDASRITPPRLVPGFDPKVGCRIEVELARTDNDDLLDLGCSQHAVRTRVSPDGVTIALARENERLNRDFVLRWRLARQTVKPSFLVHRDDAGNRFGMVTLVAPKRDVFLGAPRDVVFVVDRSGSMEGIKMTSAARACALLLASLGPRDRFAVQAFDDRVEWFDHTDTTDRFHSADEAGIERGEKYLRGITSRGGTELDAAVSAALAALDRRREKTGRLAIVVLLTDGQIGDESRVLKRIQRELGEARVFTVGIDTAVNEGFLRRLALLGGGTATFVEPGTHLEDALRNVGREIGTPLVRDVTLTSPENVIAADSLAPARIPDLFAGRATTVFFRLNGPGGVTVAGTLPDGKRFSETLAPREIQLSALSQLWAKTLVTELEDRYRVSDTERESLKARIIELALRHGLLTRFTAFVAVDEAEIVNPDGTRRRIVQPVEMPDQWEMGVDRSIVLASLMPSMPYPAPAAMPPDAPPMPMMSRSASPQSIGTGLVEGLGSLLNDGIETIAGLFTRPAHPAERAAGKPFPPDPGLEAAFQEVKTLLATLQTELDAGRLPAADAIERTRRRLLDALTNSPRAAEFPALQRLARSVLVELVAALRTPGIGTADIVAILDAHTEALAEARREASAFADGSAKPEGNFWESTI